MKTTTPRTSVKAGFRTASILTPVAPATTKAAKATKTTSKFKITTQEVNKLIEKKAYELFEARGYVNGFDQQDWLKAEAIVKKELKAA